MDLSTTVVSSPAMHQPQNGALGKLPLELKRQTFEMLEVADIKSVRLVNQHYNDIASPYLMRRAFLAARPKTMAIFKEIIGHTVFSKTIREIVFDASIFADGTHSTVTSPGMFHGIADEDLEEDTDDDLLDPNEEYMQTTDSFRDWLAEEPESSERTQALEHYRTLMVVQQSIIEHREDLWCLEHAGKVLPKLQSIRYTDWWHLGPFSWDWYWGRGPLSWDLIPMTCPPFYNDRYLNTRAAVVTRSLSSVLKYVLRGGAKISNLQIDIGGRPEFQVLGVLNKNEKRNLMPNITHLELNFGASGADSKKGASNPLKVYSRMLAQTNDLRVLHLHTNNSIWDLGGPYQNPDSVDAINSYLLPEISLKRLHKLSLLGGFYVTPDILVHLLDRHSATLQQLHLGHICLVGESATWPEVFNRMRDTLKGLKSIIMNDLYGLSDVYDDEEEVRGWSLHCVEQRLLIEKYCRWIVGNGEYADEEREMLEAWRIDWQRVVKIGSEVQSIDNRNF